MSKFGEIQAACDLYGGLEYARYDVEDFRLYVRCVNGNVIFWNMNE